MASVRVKKFGTQEACTGLVRHVYRENTNYSNCHIQKEKEGLNWYMGGGDQCRDLIHNTIAEIDKGMPPLRLKKDRKTVAGVCVVAPRENLPDSEVFHFFKKTLNDMAVENLVVGAAIHADEIHDYYDDFDDKIHTSRLHMHVLMVPETDRGCNMSTWLIKSRYTKLNDICDRVCKSIFGYNYVDGTRQKSRGSVERLKELSMLNAAKLLPDLQAQIEALKAEKLALVNEIENLKAKVKEKEAELKARMEDAEKDLKKYFSPKIKLDEILQERMIKIGFAKSEKIYVAKNPEAIMSALINTMAVICQNKNLEKVLDAMSEKLDFIVSENKVLKKENIQLKQRLERFKVWHKVELMRTGEITGKMLELKSIGMNVPELSDIDRKECVFLIEELENFHKLECYNEIMRIAKKDPILRDKLKDFMPNNFLQKEMRDQYYER